MPMANAFLLDSVLSNVIYKLVVLAYKEALAVNDRRLSTLASRGL